MVERESEATCHAFYLDKPGMGQSLVNKAVAVENHARCRGPMSDSLDSTLQAPLEWQEHRIEPWVEMVGQSCPVASCEDNVSTWLRHTSHLSNCQLGLLEPGNEANSDHEIEGCVRECQGIGIADIHRKQ